MYKKILVPVDGSSTSLRGLEEAIRIAKHCAATIHLVHVVDEFVFDAGYPPLMNYTALLDGLRASGKKVLEASETLVRQQSVACEAHLIETFGKQAAPSILNEVRATGADLIVMGTHGRRGIRRLALGSDAELVLRYASVPILLVRDSPEVTPTA